MSRLPVTCLLGCLLLGACTFEATPHPSVPPREIAGVVQGEMHLAGDVVLSADLLVPAGSRLVIDAGTRVTVVPTDTTKIDPEFLSAQVELLVRGALLIDGTADRPVTFAVARAGGGEPQWAGILLDGASDSVLRHVRVSDADTGLLLVASAAEVDNVAIDHCRYGVVVQGGTPLLHELTVSNGEGGVYFWQGSRPAVDGLHVTGNAEEGIYVDRGSVPQWQQVHSEQNAIGLVAAAAPAAGAVQLTGNGENLHLLTPQPEVPQ